MSQCSNNNRYKNSFVSVPLFERWSPKNTAILQLNWLSNGTLSVNFLNWNPFERPSWQEVIPPLERPLDNINLNINILIPDKSHPS